MGTRILLPVSLALAAASALAVGNPDQTQVDGASQKQGRDLGNMNLEDLMKVEVTTASKKAQELDKVPAAIYVITKEDIRRSGARSLPDLLRTVPGVQVGQITSNSWRVTARGFNGAFSKMLLVMIDGRSVYSPIFSGVIWDTQDLVLEDINRIEVIRGPGGSLWGANAVNGIINIITDSAAESKGELVNTGAGSADKNITELRHGGDLGKEGSYRVYGKTKVIGELMDTQGKPNNDMWRMAQSGFRADWNGSPRDMFTLQGDTFNTRSNEHDDLPTLAPPFSQPNDGRIDSNGSNILGRWTNVQSATTTNTLQVYWDHFSRAIPWASAKVDTYDVDFQRQTTQGNHDLVWGLNYRNVRDQTSTSFLVAFDPANRRSSLFGVFAQDDITLDKKTHLFIGSKLDRNDFTGWEFQPSARILHTANSHQTFWASVSRAVQTPDNAGEDANTVGTVFPPSPINPFPTLIRLIGNKSLKSQVEIANEVGMRLQYDRWSLDLTAYYNAYDHLITPMQAGDPVFVMTPNPHMEVPTMDTNTGFGNTAGFEAAFRTHVSDRWNLAANFTLFSTRLRNTVSGFDPYSVPGNGETPRHQLSIISDYDLGRGWEFNSVLNYMGHDIIGPINEGTRVDVRLGWHPSKNREIFLSIQDLFNKGGAESPMNYFEKVAAPGRSIYLGVSLKY